ncbi:MAG: ribosomal L7Ae/L30e/S12e/Gadd45 family protein [Candidatus Woesearchaeota archaeon]
MTLVEDIRKSINDEKLVIGKKEVIKNLKNKTLSKVFLAVNTPKEIVDDVEYYSSFSNVELVKTEKNNEELGVICKKSFGISVLGIME